MKIFIIGTTSYAPKMKAYAEKMRSLDNEVRMPKFDDYNLNELQICEANIRDIRWADEVHIFWDQRSIGTVFDFGAAFALRKRTRIIYMNPKTFTNVMRWYSDIESYLSEVETKSRNGDDPSPDYLPF